jgi:hypothetical protein
MVVSQSALDCTSVPRRVFFKANPEGPWPCHFCGEDIEDYQKVTVHHLDENKRHNRIKNLVGAHRSCHIRDHALRQSPEKRALIAAGVKRSWVGARTIDL